MFSSISTIFLLALPLLATASVLPRQSEHCNVNGDVGLFLCCRDVQESTTANLALFSALLGTDIPDLGGSIGCKLDGLKRSAQPACCTASIFDGLIGLGCTYINIDL
ncbi:hydrophobin-263 [Pluteus cervinus]|uniref:Hydrophobin-263 n=1 Tax=Pluteus cervinus TaxID=181527 RepID=A0ACD3AFH6_9AGAR|nr:hydrophobin-263 [Pluteus cervinus]